MQLKAMVHIAVPRIPAWVGLLALCAALVLTVGAGVLPERWQDPALFLGVGLAFGSVGGILFSVLTGARPDWQGVATVTGMILGVIPVIGLIMSPRLQHPPDATPVSVTRAAAPSSHLTAAMAFPQRTQRQPHLETQSQAGARAAPDRDTLESVLTKVTDILNNAHTSALQILSHAPEGIQRDPEGFKSQVQSVARDLESARSSLDRIAANPDFRGQLATIVGDTSALDALISALRNFGDSLDKGDPADLQQSRNLLRSQSASTSAWIVQCNRRIRTALATEKAASGA